MRSASWYALLRTRGAPTVTLRPFSCPAAPRPTATASTPLSACQSIQLARPSSSLCATMQVEVLHGTTIMAKTTSSSALVVWASASNFLLGIVQRDSTSTIVGVYGVWVFLSCYLIFYLGLKFGWEGKGLGECACGLASVRVRVQGKLGV